MGNCTSRSASIEKADKKGHYHMPPRQVPSAEAQLDELLYATGTRRLTTRVDTSSNIRRVHAKSKKGKQADWAM